jgi:hypothetical protein
MASWNSQLEKVIADEAEKCLSFAWLHDKAQKVYEKLDVWINIPVIVLSTISGTAAIGSDTLFAGSKEANIGIGLLSLFVGILNTLGSYFAWGKRSEGHRISNIAYNKIHNFMRIELSLPRPERLAPEEFLKLIKEQLDRLSEVSPPIPDKTIREYKDLFGNQHDISKPTICNGIDPIKVFSEAEESKSRRQSVSADALPEAEQLVAVSPAALPPPALKQKPQWK